MIGRKARRLYLFGRPTFLSSLGARLTAGFDRTLLGHFSMLAVTYYSIPMDVCQRGRSLTEQLTRALFPAVSDRSGNGDHEMVQRMYLRATRLLASAVVPILVMLGVFAFPVLNAWQGRSIAVPSAPVLMFAAAAFCFQFVGALQNMFLSATGRPTVMMWWNLGQGAATLLFDLLLIPRYGAVGAAAALLIVSLGVIGPDTAYVADAGGASLGMAGAEGLSARRFCCRWRALHRRGRGCTICMVSGTWPARAWRWAQFMPRRRFC